MHSEMSHDGGALTFRLSGQLTFSDHGAFRSIVGQIKDAPESTVVFDFQDAEFIDSSALGMLLLARDAAVDRKAKIILRKYNGQIEKIFTSSRFDQLFTLEQ